MHCSNVAWLSLVVRQRVIKRHVCVWTWVWMTIRGNIKSMPPFLNAKRQWHPRWISAPTLTKPLLHCLLFLQRAKRLSLFVIRHLLAKTDKQIQETPSYKHTRWTITLFYFIFLIQANGHWQTLEGIFHLPCARLVAGLKITPPPTPFPAPILFRQASWEECRDPQKDPILSARTTCMADFFAGI